MSAVPDWLPSLFQTIDRGDVTYTRHDGSSLTLLCANIFKLRGGLIGEYLIYADIPPLFAAE